MQYQITQSVKVKNAEHERAGQAGAVWGESETAGAVLVRFDTDLQVVDMQTTDLETL